MTCRLHPVLSLAAPLVAVAAHADGWDLIDRRFLTAACRVIELRAAQAARQNFMHACRHGSSRTSCLSLLNARQAGMLKNRSGTPSTRLAVTDSSKGDNLVDDPINVLVRFAERQAGIPRELLRSDAEARRDEGDTVGWSRYSPEHMSQGQVRNEACSR